MSRTSTMFACASSNTASPTTSATFCVYPRVSHASDRATRSGVRISPSRSGSSPSSSSWRRTSATCSVWNGSAGVRCPFVCCGSFAATRSITSSADLRMQRSGGRGLDRQLGLERGVVAVYSGGGQHRVILHVLDRAVARAHVAADTHLVPRGRVTDVAHGNVELVRPEERHGTERL